MKEPIILLELLHLLLLGFGLGVMHALDPDHVVAVSMLSNQKPSFKHSLFHCMHWALGHGSVLLLAGVLLFGLGVMIPELLQKSAEASVGVVLIVLGLLCFKQFKNEKLTATACSQNNTRQAPGTRKPVFIGALHGLAGSVPALALIPAVASGELLVALLYLLLFSLGVLLSMLAFGFGFGACQRYLSQRYRQVFQYSRRALATVSIVLGGFWLAQVLPAAFEF